MTRVAVIGAGAAGLYAAWHLARRDLEVELIERDTRVGGHVDTHLVGTGDGSGAVAVDSGFIVFNPAHYPIFCAWLDELGVETRATDMSFGVHCERSGMAYNASGLNGLFCQRRNLFRPAFVQMVREILHFYRRAPALLASLDERETLGAWLARSGYSNAFARDHLRPMAAALWSTPDQRINDFPMRYMLKFMQNHNMLQATGRPVWRTVCGGSRRYVDAALDRFAGRVRTGCPVRSVRRNDYGGVDVVVDGGLLRFDRVVLACHADQALRLIDDPRPVEREVLGAFEYRDNETVLHTDARRLPASRRAWASWNVRRDRDAPEEAAISYYMNRLQGLPGPTPYIVSLNQTERIDADCILVRRRYRHPVYTPATRAAQRRLSEINGTDRLWFCGAGWGWGFHEDAVRSAARVVEGLTPEGLQDAA